VAFLIVLVVAGGCVAVLAQRHNVRCFALGEGNQTLIRRCSVRPAWTTPAIVAILFAGALALAAATLAYLNRFLAVAELLGGAVLTAGLASAGGTFLYYLWLPANPGPDNASPPPEGVGLMFGALLGCAVAATVIALLREAQRAVMAWALALLLAVLAYLAFGGDGIGGRLADSVIAVIVTGLGIGLGVGVAAMLSGVAAALRVRRSA
jgi:hypothetical protein